MRLSIRNTILAVLVLALGFGPSACRKDAGGRAGTAAGKGDRMMEVKRGLFGRLADGEAIDIYTLTNKSSGIEARVMTYGATLVSLRLPEIGRAHV